jgi:hypothetical protein
MALETCYLARRQPVPACLASAVQAAYTGLVQAKTMLEELALRQ